MPKFSIIIPVYNVAPYLRECLDSVLAQTFTDWECLCVNDGSTDESGAILDEYAAKDSRFRVFHKPNGGVSSARNLALDNAKGQWILFLDGDDFYTKNGVLNILSDALSEQNKRDLLYFRKERFFTNCKLMQKKKDHEKRMMSNSFNNFPCELYHVGFCDCVYHREILNSIRFKPFVLGEDLIFFNEYLLKIGNVFFLDEVLYSYRIREGSATASFSFEKLNSLLRIRAILLDLYQQNPQRIPDAWFFLLSRFLKWGFPKVVYQNRKKITKSEVLRLAELWKIVLQEFKFFKNPLLESVLFFRTIGFLRTFITQARRKI